MSQIYHGTRIVDATIDNKHFTSDVKDRFTTAKSAFVDNSGTHTLTLVNAGTVLGINSASLYTVIIPQDSTVPFPTGTLIEISQEGSGQIVVSGEGGVIIRNADTQFKTAKQWASIGLRKRGPNDWVLTGYTAE